MTTFGSAGSPPGPTSSGGSSDGSGQPPGPQGRRALLTHTLEQDIIPRLLQAHPDPEAPLDRAALADRPVGQAHVRELVRLALLPEDLSARAYVESLRVRGVPVDMLFSDLIGPASRYLGELWCEDTATFSDVTVGVGRLQQIMRDIGPALPARSSPDTPPRRILLLPSPGDQHSLGLLMVSEYFRSAGWDVSGGPLPNVDAAAAVRRDWFDVVGFSLGGVAHLPRLGPAIAAVRKASVNPRVGILVGGPLFFSQPGLAGQVGADAVAVDGALAPEIAAKLLETRAIPC
jgi:methanogenic corrinoid protein MtbC1